MRFEARVRFLTTSFYIRKNAIWILQTLQVETPLLIELLSGIRSGIGSEVHEAFKDTGTTHIIAISGFKLLSIDALCRDRIELGVPVWR